MPELLEIAEKLQDTHAMVVQLEQTIALKGDPPPSILMTLNSLKRRQESLESQFAAIAGTEHLDVCRYQLFPQMSTRPTLTALSKTLLGFQGLFTQVYDALSKHVQRMTSKISAEVVAETAFSVAYTFPGSLGIVLTMPNERLLIGETTLDEAMRKVFDMAKAETPEQIAEHVRDVGVAPVRALYQWVSDQLLTGVTSHVEWRRQEEIRSQLRIQSPELERTRRAIEATSAERTSTYDVVGELRGWDIDTKTFHLQTETDEIRGKLSDEVADTYSKQTVQVPKIYAARIRTTTTISLAYEKESTTHQLLSLEPLGRSPSSLLSA